MTVADLVRSLLTIVPRQLVDDETATQAIIDVRWPGGPRCLECSSTVIRRATQFLCEDSRCRTTFSIFVGTGLESLRRPRPRALLLALKAIATDKRGISARALARTVGVPPVTMWRHIHRLRDLLPAVAPTRAPAAFVQVCGRHGGDTAPASSSAAHAGAAFLFTAAGIDCVTVAPSARIVGESIRTWLSGTFHGVTARHLFRYLCEATARCTYAPTEILTHVLARLLGPPPCPQDHASR